MALPIFLSEPSLPVRPSTPPVFHCADPQWMVTLSSLQISLWLCWAKTQ